MKVAERIELPTAHGAPRLKPERDNGGWCQQTGTPEVIDYVELVSRSERAERELREATKRAHAFRKLIIAAQGCDGVNGAAVLRCQEGGGDGR